ncbi:hypothetical protein F5Y06DRAFT_306385 [Hypoxylon sp. FL0890]|nr:hypothetical protein F5Y06DRAFT_306385 [Hypoxylon sp. FL0890]
MSLSVSKAVCLCTIGPRRSEGVPAQVRAGRKPSRSGKCVGCGVARHREARVFNTLPKDLVLLSEAARPLGSVRGYQDDNFSCRLSVIQIISKVTTGLTHEEEVNLAGRVYTQLKLEGNPLIDPWWERHANWLPDAVFGQLHKIMRDQLGRSYKHYASNEMPNII